MSISSTIIENEQDLYKALAASESDITIARHIRVGSAITLPPNTTLRGQPQENGELPTLSFRIAMASP